MELKIFAEYMVAKGERDIFFSLLQEVKEYQVSIWSVKDFEIYEGTDQPNLFVEEFDMEGEDNFNRLKEERLLEKDALWKKLNSCIVGGRDKLHIWAFKKID